MQELRLVAVSEDGSYAILAVPGRSGRFLLPIDERLRTVAKGQFSRLAQYEIEVENPLRPKEIQERIRAGETADQIADAAGIPPDKIRRFEGPILAERQYQAQQAQRATIRGRGDSGPGPRLGDVVAERLTAAGASPEAAEWDSRKRPDGNWQVQLQFVVGGRAGTAEWIYDPRRRHVIPDDDQAVRLCLPQDEWAAITFAERARATATVTPIASRQHGPFADAGRELDRRAASALPRARDARDPALAVAAEPDPVPAAVAAPEDGIRQPGEAAAAGRPDQAGAPAPAKKTAKGRRASVPSWDEIMFGTSRQQD
ncbi:MAG TPA: septation protein SepH [Streptosporangiaceae bacterium]|nr:septation protein SepH [Streptosporangiaceae bacterium]